MVFGKALEHGHSRSRVTGWFFGFTYRNKGYSSCIVKLFPTLSHTLRHVCDDTTCSSQRRVRKLVGILRQALKSRDAFTCEPQQKSARGSRRLCLNIVDSCGVGCMLLYAATVVGHGTPKHLLLSTVKA